MSTYSILKTLKKDDIEKINERIIENLIVGYDSFSVISYQKSVEKNGEENVLLLSENEIDKSDLRDKGPRTLRGEENIDYIKSNFPDQVSSYISKTPVFFKEGSFRSFKGRKRPEKLLWGEEYFTREYTKFNISEIFSCLADEKFLDELNNRALILTIKEIMPSDEEGLNFEVKCTNGDIVKCKNLTWGLSPSRFLKLYTDKSSLDSSFIEFCEQSIAPQSLYVRFIYDREITDKSETLFFPLSYTHDWGHFIGEFNSFEEGEKEFQEGRFLTFLDPEQTTEEEVAKKIRILKKSIDKAIDGSKAFLREEFISLDDNTSVEQIDDELILKENSMLKGLKFVGKNAPILNPIEGIDCKNISSFARGLSSCSLQ